MQLLLRSFPDPVAVGGLTLPSQLACTQKGKVVKRPTFTLAFTLTRSCKGILLFFTSLRNEVPKVEVKANPVTLKPEEIVVVFWWPW